MDYPKSVPNVGLIDGHFVDENPLTGQVGSLIPAAWGDAITQEVLNVIKGAGMVPKEENLSQLLTAILTIAASDFKKSVVVATTGPIALSGLQAVDGVAVTAGARVLVKNQANAAQNWIYVAAAGAWVRAEDANESVECTPGHLVSVQSGSVNAGAVWQLSNTTQPVLGVTALNFTLALGKTGVVAGTYRQVAVDVLGRIVSGSNPTTLAGYGITDALRVGVTSVQQPSLAAPLPGGTDGSGSGGALQIREAQQVGNTQTGFAYAPRVVFHWQGVRAKDLAMTYGGELSWGGDVVWNAGNFDPGTKANKATTLAGYGIGDAFTQAQTTAAIQAQIAALIGTAPGALDQLDELARAIGNDPNFSTTIINALAKKADTDKALKIGVVSQQRPILSASVAAGQDNGADGAGGAIEIREVKEVGSSQSGPDYAPGILFNWSSKFARYLKMTAVGDLIWGNKKVWTEWNFTPADKANVTDMTTALALKANLSDVLAAAAMTANGRLMMPTSSGTLYVQWYEGPISGAETVAYPAVSHPVPFPNQCLFAGVFTRSTTGNTLSDQMFQMEYWDRLGVKVFPQWFGTGNQSLVKPLIFTIGN